MKKIAKYNKELELDELNDEVENKKKEIKDLDKKLQDKGKRWEKVKRYIANIYDIDIDDYDDFEKD